MKWVSAVLTIWNAPKLHGTRNKLSVVDVWASAQRSTISAGNALAKCLAQNDSLNWSPRFTFCFSVSVSSSAHVFAHSAAIYGGPRPASIWGIVSGVQPMIKYQFQPFLLTPANNQETPGCGLHGTWQMKKLKSRRGFGVWREGGEKKKETVGEMRSRPKTETQSGCNRFQSADRRSHIALSWWESGRHFSSPPVAFHCPICRPHLPMKPICRPSVTPRTWGGRDRAIVGELRMWTAPGSTQAPVPATGRSPRNAGFWPLGGYSFMFKCINIKSEPLVSPNGKHQGWGHWAFWNSAFCRYPCLLPPRPWPQF